MLLEIVEFIDSCGVSPHLQIGIKERDCKICAVFTAAPIIIIEEKEKEKEKGYFDSACGISPRTPIVIVLKERKGLNFAVFTANTTNDINNGNIGKGVSTHDTAATTVAIEFD